MKKLFLFIIYFVVIHLTNLQAQFFESTSGNDVFENYTRLGLQLDGLVFAPADIGNPPEGTSFKSQASLSYKVGLVYNFKIVPSFGLRIGALIGQTPAINTSFELQSSRTGNSTDYVHNQGAVYSPLTFSFPLLAEYRGFALNNLVTSLVAGIQVQRTSPGTITETYENYYITEVSNPGSWDFDLIAKAGIYLPFSKFMLQPSIVYKYRLQDQYTGTYTFTNLQNPTLNNVVENYTLKGNYIGLSLDFYLFSPHRQVAAGCAGSVHSKGVLKRKKAQEKAQKKLEKKKRKALKKKEKEMRKRAKKRYFK
jgi:hypothetical protein